MTTKKKIGGAPPAPRMDHNLPVAVLGPLPGRGSALERLLAEGRVVPARLDLAVLGVPPDRPREETISEALAAQREES